MAATSQSPSPQPIEQPFEEFEYYYQEGNLNLMEVFITENRDVCLSKEFVETMVENLGFDFAIVACKIQGGHEVLAKILKSHPEYVKKTDQAMDRTLIHVAAMFNQTETVKLLLDHHDINPMAKDIDGQIPLSSAIFSGNAEIFSMILAKVKTMKDGMATLDKYKDEFGYSLKQQAKMGTKKQEIHNMIDGLMLIPVFNKK
jgi:ankyrin repeat protein